jgi:hypothetical protein
MEPSAAAGSWPRFAIEDVATPGIRAYQQRWDDLRGDRFAPSWREVHLGQLDPKNNPYIVVSDVPREPVDFTIRFWGRNIPSARASIKPACHFPLCLG